MLATEETSDGGAYEFLDPTAITKYTVADRSAGEIRDATNAVDADQVVKRTDLPAMAWEGLTVLPNGVVIGGDEPRQGGPADADGGALFKFIPATPHAGGDIAILVESSLASGTV